MYMTQRQVLVHVYPTRNYVLFALSSKIVFKGGSVQEMLYWSRLRSMISRKRFIFFLILGT